MNRLLVTGASGFLGGQVIRLLSDHHAVDVVAVGRQVPAVASDGVNWLRADLLVPGVAEAVVEEVMPSHLLHLAWEATPGSYLESPANLGWLAASSALLSSFLARGGQRFVGIGTCLEYDVTTGTLCRELRTPLRPSTLYGATKHAFSVAALRAGQTLGASTAWVRLFHLYGPNEHPDRLVAYVIRSLLEGRHAELSSGDQIRDYLSVMEAGEAILAVLGSDIEGPVNLGSGSPVPVRDVARAIAQLCGSETLLRFGSHEAQDGAVRLLAPDVTRLTEEVGWRSRLSLEDGLRETIQWWRKRSAM